MKNILLPKYALVIISVISSSKRIFCNLLVRESNSENSLDFAAPLVRKLSLYQIQIISQLQSENSCWICQVLVASKIPGDPKEVLLFDQV